MPNQTHSSYRGCAITTRWTEVRVLPDWFQVETPPGMQDKGVRDKGFTASFSVDPPAENDSSWQEFPHPVFDTSHHAAEHALAVAKRSIDLKFAVAHVLTPPV